MGEKTTRPAGPDIERAKSLKDALERGRPTLHRRPESSSPTSLSDLGPHQAWFDSLIECAPEAVCILDLDEVIVRVNGEFTHRFGYSADEAVGHSVDELVVPSDRESESIWIREVLSRGERVTMETRRRHKDGSLLDTFISGTPIIVQGKQVGVYVRYRDISEEKRVEALSLALYRIAEKTTSSKDLQQLYAALHSIVGELMYAPNFYIALYDPARQVLTFPYFVDEKSKPPVRQKLEKGRTEYVLRTGEPLLCTPEVQADLVSRGEVGNPGSASMEWLGVPLKAGDETFGVVAVQSYAENPRLQESDKQILTFVSRQLASAIQHKRSEDALRRSEAQYRSLVQSAVYGMYRSTLDGKFLDVNPAIVAMLGYNSTEEVLALDPRQDVFLDPGQQNRLMREFRRGVRLTNVEVLWKHRDGHAVTIRLSGRAVKHGEEENVVEVIAEDVTERRILEDQFRQSQKMEAVGRLAGGVAHDFNNFLTVIRGYTELLLDPKTPQDQVHQRVEAIQVAADRSASLTRQLLAFSRKQLLELKVLNLNSIVRELERLLRPLIGENIQITSSLGVDLGPVRADVGQIEQVIMNLVINSRDAMPKGGRIRIETANVILDESVRQKHSYVQPGSYVMLAVVDNGQGMDATTQARIFEPYFTTKQEGKGTGLGLSTVYGIIKQLRGYILAESVPGMGSTFRIYLPNVEEIAEVTAPAQSQPQPASATVRGSETVLLVEDEESVRSLIRETLLTQGYKVLEAESGETALYIAAAQEEPIDILITDLVMPGISGRDVARQVCELNPDTHVLYLSGYPEDAIVNQGILEAGTAFLQKPFTLQKLYTKVREVLRNR